MMWYPFEPIEMFKGRPLNRYWLHKHLTDPAFDNRFTFYDYCHFVPALCEAGRTIASFPGTRYAYHFDANLLGEHLKRIATERGVVHVEDTITGVLLDTAGDPTDRHPAAIAAVERAGGAPLSADLFIDCTGFGALLLGQHLGEPFDSYGDYLFNDRAIALSVPYVDKETELFSYTRCTALSSGWVWEIPLYSRIGTGYVYSSRHQAADEAEAELRRFLGPERTKDAEARHLDIRIGKHTRTWVGNCVALGLSAGFIEPLESTGIQTVQGALDVLTHTLRATGGDYSAGDVAVYNDSVTQLFEIIRDFLVTHYALTARDDTPYWCDVKHTTRISPNLSEKLRLARAKMPDREILHRFDDASLAGFYFEDGWQNIFVGMNHLPFAYEHVRRNQAGPFEPTIEANLVEADAQYERISANKARLDQMPSHYELLRAKIYRGRP
jgi:tryptophan halogenase